MFGVNLPVGKNDDNMADWSCVSTCCSCNGCNKNFANLGDLSDECKATVQNITADNVQVWYRSSMDQSIEPPSSKARRNVEEKSGLLMSSAMAYYSQN